MKRALSVLFLVLVSTACYHANVVTGLQPNGQTIERPWAHGFLWGLVPPSTIETMAECPNGVARVETKHSFLNQLAAGLTSGIYTPISITVSCAAPEEMEQLGQLPMVEDADAAREAIESGEPFLVRLR